jgi:dihydropteroate synthase
VALDEELRRVIPLIEALSAKRAVISVDTDKAEVARRAREAGAKILNDVTALRGDPLMMAEALKFVKVILMHMRGTPKTMQDEPEYNDVVQEVKNFLLERVSEFVKAGGDRVRVLADPGLGFGKTLEQNLSLLKHAGTFAEAAPVVIGVSRKSFLSKVTPDQGPEDRLAGSLAAAVWAAAAEAAAVRVHDVAATRRALELVAAVQGAA